MSDHLKAPRRLSHVMIRCTESGEQVPAGLRIDAASFKTGDHPDKQNVKCPHCGQEHTWSMKDAWIEDVF
jgi:phage terminase large subunit GpA-like protein